MSTFKIQDTDTSVNIVETHYYNWLKGQNLDNGLHFMTTKLIYLKEQGFTQGVDHLSEDDLSTLCVIERVFARWEINTKKTLDKINNLIGKTIKVTHPKIEGAHTYNVIGFDGKNDVILKRTLYPKGEPFTVDKFWFDEEAERTILIVN